MDKLKELLSMAHLSSLLLGVALGYLGHGIIKLAISVVAGLLKIF